MLRNSRPQLDTPITKLPCIQIARNLSREFVSLYASEISLYFKQYPPEEIEQNKSKFQFNTGILGITITSKTASSIILRAQCKRFWKRALEKSANEDRLNHEAKNGIVGETNLKDRTQAPQLYCSTETLLREQEKNNANIFALAGQYVYNTQTGKTVPLLEIVSNKENYKIAEVYNICKSLERLADSQGFKWLFITFTAPAQYHPNPSKGKRRYDRELGIRASHDYIRHNWRKIRSILSYRKILASPDSYFGFRTIEPHKDGSIHWHLIMFTSPQLISEITRAIREKFRTDTAAKIMLGKSGPGSAKASSYIFKYLTKAFSKKDTHQTSKDKATDVQREANDLASMRNRERVQAAIKAINARQFQIFGVNNLITTFRKINSLKLNDIHPEKGSTLEYIKEKIWRNQDGYLEMLSNQELFGSDSRVSLIMERSQNRYGETIKKCTGIKIGDRVFPNNSIYEIKRNSVVRAEADPEPI